MQVKGGNCGPVGECPAKARPVETEWDGKYGAAVAGLVARGPLVLVPDGNLITKPAKTFSAPEAIGTAAREGSRWA